MVDFGAELRAARERKGISLRQIAATTKISVAALERLERNDISRLPGGIFSRAFVRSYATEVGLDPDETVRRFLDQFGESVGGTQAHPAAGPTFAAGRSGGPPTDASSAADEVDFESRQRMAAVVLKLVLVSVPIAAAIIYFSSRSSTPRQSAPEAVVPEVAAPPQPGAVEGADTTPLAGVEAPTSEPRDTAAAPPETPATPESRPASEPGPPSELQPASESQPASELQPASDPQPATDPQPVSELAPAPAPPASPVSEGDAAPVRLEILPSADCWVKLTIDGDVSLSRIVMAGEREAREFSDTAVLQVGDAAACAIAINGHPAKPLGRPKQVREIRITRDNYRALLP